MESFNGFIASSFFCLLLIVPVQTTCAQVVGILNTGVVVERVLQHSEAAKAGVHEGDVIVRWACGDAHGDVQSPFDLNATEIEQAPRGNVLLEGLRGPEKRTWQLGQDRWGIEVRTNFPDAVLTLYQTGQDLARAGKLGEAKEKWRLIRDQGDSSNRQWQLFHLAGLEVDARHWKESDQSYQEALQFAASNQDVVVQIEMAWGRSFVQRNDWVNAGEHFDRAMVAAQVMGDNSLAFAMILDELGGLADRQGDLKKAEGYYQQALRVRESLNPASLSTSISLHNLGALAYERGDLDMAEELDQRALAMAEKISPSSLCVAQALGNLGDVEFDRGKLAKAGEYYRRSFDLNEALGPDGLGVAKAFHRLGRVALLRGEVAKAKEYYREALSIREKVAPDGMDVAESLSGIGWLASERGDLAKAEDYGRRALSIQEKVAPDGLDVATSLSRLGWVAWQRSDLAKAEEYNRRALAIRERLAPRSLDVAQSLSYLGLVAWQRGDLAKAEEYFRRALTIWQRLAPDSVNVGTSLANLGNVAYDRGDLAKSEEYYRQALAIEESLAPGSIRHGRCLNNLGIVAYDRGDLAKSEEYDRQALVIFERLAPGSLVAAESLNNLGSVALGRGDPARAEDYHRRALAIRERLAPDSLYVARSLNNLGEIARNRGDLAKAEEYERTSLAIREKLAPGSREVADILNDLGMIARERGDVIKAEKYYRQVLRMREKLAPFSVDMGWNLNLLAKLLEGRGALEEAEQCYRKASAILDQLAPGSENLADSLAGLASVRRRQGRLEEAAQFYAQALDAFEAQAAHLGGAADIRADFRAKRGNYRDYMGVLLAQGKPEAAFAVLERSRARILLEILATAHVDIRKGVSAELLKKERSLQGDIKAKSDRRVHLLSEKQSDKQVSEEQVKAVEKEISALTDEYQDVEAQIRSKSPAYAALTQPQTLSAKEIQQQLLDADTVLLEYSLDEPRSHVFLVSSNSLEVFALPRRSVIEAASRRVYELLTARNRGPKGEKAGDRIARIDHAEAEFPQAAGQLSRMVLGPVAGKIENKRLLIVSDGALNYIPFAALPLKSPGQTAAPLVVGHEIVNLPSASVLAVLRREREGRPAAGKTVAVLADPVFHRGDVRVKKSRAANSQNAEATPSGAELQAVHAALQDRPGGKDGEGAERKVVTEPSAGSTAPSGAEQTATVPQEEPLRGREESLDPPRLNRSAADVGWKRTHSGEVYLPRLLATRWEAEAIVSMAPAGKSFEALDFQANRATATSVELANYGIVHFATHALLDSKHPELSGLVLSLVNERGRPQSGFLGLEDIYNLNLPAELVVLSACETALGKGVEGEGILGLTRGFMYAGASRVVASLWNIDDEATAEQMRYFYRAMLGEGMRPAAALRTAQMKLRHERRWNSPYFWAAFQIQGEWK